MTLSGELGTVRAEELATLRAMLAGVNVSTQPRTVHEEMALLRQYRRAILFALEKLPKSAQTAGIANRTTWAVVARAWYCIPAKQLSRFCQVLKTGVGATDQERPIIMLWRCLAAHRGHGLTHASQRKRYGLTQRALAAYVDNEQLSLLRAATLELFLLPEEVAEPEYTVQFPMNDQTEA